MDRPSARVWRAIRSRTFDTSAPRAEATRAAWYSAASGLMCGSSPPPEAVTRSAGTRAFAVFATEASAAFRSDFAADTCSSSLAIASVSACVFSLISFLAFRSDLERVELLEPRLQRRRCRSCATTCLATSTVIRSISAGFFVPRFEPLAASAA